MKPQRPLSRRAHSPAKASGWPQADRSKYRAVKTMVDGVLFASKAEAKRYGELKYLQAAGKIWDLELQPRFPLCVVSTSGQAMRAAAALAGTFNGRIGEYRGDFRYHDLGGIVVEDVKGFDTPLSKWKRKHAETQYNITIRIVR